MNVLLITFSFPPAGGVGVLRAVSLAKYLPESGLRVDVLAARNAPSVGKDSSLLKDLPAAVTIHRCWTLDLPFGLRKLVKKIVAGRAPSSTPQQPVAGGKALPTKPSLLKRLVADLLLPDPQVGWLPFALPAAKKIIRDRQIDVVVVTVPPFSSVRLVTALRKAFADLPIVLDFRDEWLTTTLHLVSFNNNQRALTVAAKAESEAVRDASLVVAVTEAARLEILHRYPEQPPAKFACIPNGFDMPTKPASAPQPSDRIVLTYIGTVYGSTDPTTLVKAVLGLPPEARERLRLRFIGHIETESYRNTLLSLGDTISLSGFVPQAEALKAIDTTDYLLLITHDRINVAAKFYDYLGGGKTIVAAVHPEGDVRKLLEETGAGIWADVADVNSIGNLLLSILAPQPRIPQRNDLTIAGYHRRPLAARYAELLRGLTLKP